MVCDRLLISTNELAVNLDYDTHEYTTHNFCGRSTSQSVTYFQIFLGGPKSIHIIFLAVLYYQKVDDFFFQTLLPYVNNNSAKNVCK